MSGSVNKCLIIGNLTRDAEIRTTQDGREIANLTVATSESWTDKQSGEKREKAEFHKVVVFNPSVVAFIKQYLNKGNKVYVEGQLQTRKWQDNSGADRYSTEIVVQAYNGTVVSLGQLSKKEDAQSYAKATGASEAELDSEIPF